jgi:tetratricopeptide (TPR) repeat protein
MGQYVEIAYKVSGFWHMADDGDRLTGRFVNIGLSPAQARVFGILGERSVPLLESDLERFQAGNPQDVLALLAKGVETYLVANPDVHRFDAFLGNYHFHQGVCFANAGNLLQAYRHLVEAHRVQPDDVQAAMDLAKVVFDLGRFEEARALYTELAGGDIGEFEVMDGLARSCALSGDVEAAVKFAVEAVRRFPDDWRALDLLTTMYYHGGETAKLEIGLFDQLAAAGGGVLALEKFAVYLRESGRTSEARTCIDRALAMGPGEARLRYQLGMIQWRAGQTADARATFEGLLAEDAGYMDALNSLGLLCLEQHEAIEAGELFRRAIRTKPRDYRAHVNLGGMLAVLSPDRRDESLAHFKRALDLHCGDAGALKQIAVLAEEMGAADVAREAQRQLKRLAAKSSKKDAADGPF